MFKKKKKVELVDGKIYTCKECGYHQGFAWFGKMLNCKGCGEFDWEEFIYN